MIHPHLPIDGEGYSTAWCDLDNGSAIEHVFAYPRYLLSVLVWFTDSGPFTYSVFDVHTGDERPDRNIVVRGRGVRVYGVGINAT